MSIFHKSKNRKGGRGQGLVEFALAFPIFLLIVLGIFEFGRLFLTYTSLYVAAREGARFGAAVDNLSSCGAGIQSNAMRVGFLAQDIIVTHKYDHGAPGTGDDFTTCDPGGTNLKLGDRVLVTASVKPYKSITGIIPSINLESTAERTIIRDVHLSYTLPPPGAATAIPTGTNTPGPTPTETPYGTPPADTPTVTPTTGGVCNGTIEWTPSGTNSYQATFVNNSGTQYTLQSITITWENTDPTLTEILYISTGQAITSLEATSPATIDVNWLVSTGTSLFDFIFSSNAKNIGIQFNMVGTEGSCVTNPE